MTVQERIPKNIKSLTVACATPTLVPLIRGVLGSLGFEDQNIIDEHYNQKHHVSVYSDHDPRIKTAADFLHRLKIPGIKVSYRNLEPKDWATRWKSVWKPAPLTKNMDVVPLWHRKEYKKRAGRPFILMDTLLSFGTGLHETTRIVAQMIEDHQGQLKKVLDIGTGTGVLAMVALKYGARDVVALDIGDLSVEAAKSNLKLNRLTAKVILADISKYQDKTKYDFVAANLITHDLIKFRRRIVSFVKQGGLLAVSGISLERLTELKQGFADQPLKLVKIVKAKQWCGVLFERKYAGSR